MLQTSLKHRFIRTSTGKDLNTLNGCPYSSWDDQNGTVVVNNFPPAGGLQEITTHYAHGTYDVTKYLKDHLMCT